jgi:signal transduction histidine kinase
MEALDLARAVADVVALLKPQKVFKEVVFAIDLGAGPIPVRSDGDRLRQVLMNLFFNASDSMGGNGRITVAAAPDAAAGEVRLTVADTGCGMDREELERIFEPFYTTKIPGAGTGLGLAVSQRLIESMGGRIMVESEQGRGSTFTVVLKTP